MSGLTITTRGAGGESRKILTFNDLPEAVRDRVLIAAYLVSMTFGNGEISECEPHVEAELEELEDAVREMEQHAQEAGPRVCN